MPLNSLRIWVGSLCKGQPETPASHSVKTFVLHFSSAYNNVEHDSKILSSYGLIKDIKGGEAAASFTRVTEFFRDKPALLLWLVSKSRRWFLTSSVLVDPGSACEGGRPPGWCTLPQAYGSLDMLTASTILIAT